MWVVADHPTDYPDYFIARKRYLEGGKEYITNHLVGFYDLDKLHAYFREELHLVFLYRNEEDDPVIVGTYI